MIEVFRTNVSNCEHAKVLLERIHSKFSNYEANFDLDDCDKILRVKCNGAEVNSCDIISLVGEFGYRIEILQESISQSNLQ